MTMKQVITGIDLFVDAHPDQAVMSIRRVGGGMYRVIVPHEPILVDEDGRKLPHPHEYKTVRAAVKYAEEVAKTIDADPSIVSPASGAQRAQLEAELTARDDRIAELEAQLAEQAGP